MKQHRTEITAADLATWPEFNLLQLSNAPTNRALTRYSRLSCGFQWSLRRSATDLGRTH